MTRQGSLQVVDVPLIRRRGTFFVMAARIRNISQWKISILSASIGSPLFYLLSVGIGVGSYVNKNSTHGIDGVKYLTFLAPALLAQVAIQDALSDVTLPTLQGFKWEKNFFAMNATPLTGRQIALGTWLAGLVRVCITVTCYIAVMYCFQAIHGLRPLLATLTALFGAASFSAIMLWATAAVKNDELFLTIVQRIIIMPLFLFSGTFYPLSSMPIYLQWIGWLSPVWHSTEIGRWLTYHHHLSSSAIAFHFLYFATLLTCGLTLAVRAFERRLAK